MGIFARSIAVALLVSVAPAAAQTPAAAASDVRLEPDTIISEVDARHLRAIAKSFSLETVLERAEPGTLLLAVREPGQPTFNLVATTCASPDRLSKCPVLITRMLFDPTEKPFTPAMANELNLSAVVGKATLLEDGRMQLDRFMYLSGGVTFANIRDNISVTYQTFALASESLYSGQTGK
jgi:hypothetical protein